MSSIRPGVGREASPFEPRERRLDLLGSPVLALAVLLLLLNDFVLKPAFHDWITGKLSDAAGIVVVSVLGCALWPRRRWTVAAVASVGFAFWKSASSQSLIDLVNEELPVRIGRTVDATDLIVLPLAWLVCLCVPSVCASRPAPWRSTLVMVLAAFALASTSRALGPHLEGRVLFPRADSAAVFALFDRVAARHGLGLTRQDSDSRVYVENVEHRPLSLEVHLPEDSPEIDYLILYNSRDGKATPQGDALRADIREELLRAFPGVKIHEERRKS
jgi:hypothetical protein